MTTTTAATSDIKLFDKWTTEGITVKDAGLLDYIDLHPVIIPKSGGRHARNQFYKSKLNIVERLVNKLFVPGHKGKKHKLSSGRCTGKTETAMKIVRSAFTIIEERTKQNPIEVLVRAVENAAPIEEVLTYQKGGIFAREAVTTAPQRRVDVALRHITQGAYKKTFNTTKTAVVALADEIVAASKNDQGSFAVSERTRKEKEAIGAR